MRTEIDLNECEHFLKANWDRSKRVNTFSKQTEIDLNECEHFLKVNWDRSKRVWTLSQKEQLRSIFSMNSPPPK